MLNRARLWIRSVVLRRRLESDMQEEMAEHLGRATTRLMTRGVSADRAAHQARREFGNVAYLQEEGRLARGTGGVDGLVADCRYALRQYARRPGTTLVMFAVLAIGMSISTLMFSFVHLFSVQPPPGVSRADDLVRIRGSQDGRDGGRVARGFSESELLEYRKLTGDFAAVAGWTKATAGLDAGEDVERRGLDAEVTFVTENYFSVLGVRPALGPGFRASGDPAGATVAVIGHTAWDQLFGRSPGVIGSTVSVDGVPVTIVGVAPEEFTGVDGNPDLQLWMPLPAWRVVMRGPPQSFQAAARLRPGVDPDAATAAVRVVAARAVAAEAARSPVPVERRPLRPSAEAVPLLAANADPGFDQEMWGMTLGLGLLGMLVLLVTCTNVSALLTGLAAARRQEIAIRLSVGAGRGRILRQLLTESALLACVAGAAAIGLAALALRVGERFGIGLQLELTWPAVAFTFGVALAVGVLFGLSPALHATRLALAGVLRDTAASIAASRGRLQSGLVVAQVAFTMPLVVLLTAMVLVLRNEFREQGRTELDEQVVTLSVRTFVPWSGPPAAVAEATGRLRATGGRVAQRLRTTPGVETAVIQWQPLWNMGAYFVDPADRVGGGESPSQVGLYGQRVEADYFGIMGIRVVRGRGFQPSDLASGAGPRPAEVPAVIGPELAQALWPGADPVGRRLRSADDDAGGARTLVVVGVAEDPQAEPQDPDDPWPVFLPPDTSGVPVSVLLRTAGSAAPLVASIRKAAQEEAPGTAIQVQTLAEIKDAQRQEMVPATGGLVAAGLMALLLSAIGLYAVVAFSVSQRTAEIAVRIAVGAHPRQVGRRFVRNGLRLSAIGLALGLPVSLLGLRAIMSADQAFAVVSLPVVTLVAGLGVVLVATAATWLPARRAASVDPAVVLRGQ